MLGVESASRIIMTTTSLQISENAPKVNLIFVCVGGGAGAVDGVTVKDA